MKWNVRYILAMVLVAVGGNGPDAATGAVPHPSQVVAARPRADDASVLTSPAKLDVRHVTLLRALAALERASGASFVFSPSRLKDAADVSCRCQDITVAQALDRLLAGTGMRYSEIGAHVLIEPADMAPPAAFPGLGERRVRLAGIRRPAQGTAPPGRPIERQDTVVTGVVLDANTGEPLSGVSVTLVGTQRGTLTDEQGRFQLPAVPRGTQRLRASRIGYAAQEQSVAVGDGPSVDVSFHLQSQAVQLEGVVAVGYGTLRRRDVTGAITSVSAEQLRQQPAISVVQGLQGRTAGVQIVQNSGEPGVAATVRIRGGNSFRGGNDPLYVVDGLPVPGLPLNTLNPDDVASVEVLKDASATAIYGARGANGVVLITTKRGTVGRNRVTFESFAGVQQVAKRIDMLNAREFADIANERARNDGSTLPFPDVDALPADTDWQDELFRAAPIQNHTLTFSGGGEQTRYLLAANYLDQQGTIRNRGFQRGALRFNFDQEVSSRFRISSSLNLSRSENNQGAPTTGNQGSVVYDALGAPPVVPVLDENGAHSAVNGFPFSPATLEHPITHALDPLDRTVSFRIVGNASGEYELLDGLRAKLIAGTLYTDRKQDIYNPRTVVAGTPSGSGSTQRTDDVTYVTESTLTLDRELGRVQRIHATTGFSYQTNRFSEVWAGSEGFVTDDLENRNLGGGERFGAPGTESSQWTLASYLGRLNYTLRDRYILTVTARYDGSSRFGTNNKWAFFPSAALAWRLSEEPFAAGATWLSDLKLRASWGRTGNQEIPLYHSLQQIASEQVAFGDGPATGFAPVTVSNPDLRWETTEQIDVGADLGLLDQRFRIAADVYRKNTSDLLALVQLPTSSGYAESVQNVGAIRNTGVELSLGADLIRRSALLWTIDANISANRNVVTRTAGGADVLASRIGALIPSSTIVREGEPLGAFYGFVEDGLDQNGAIAYMDQDGDGAITDGDRVILGDPYPDFNYGLNTTLRYGRFELNAFVQGVAGAEVLNMSRFYFANSFNRGLNQVREVLDYWTPENPNASYPKISANTNYRVSDRFVEDASYLRLKNVRIAYDFPSAWLRLARVTDATVYVSAQNLFTRTDYSWFDPEVSVYGDENLRFGIDNSGFPQSRTFTFGLRFSL